MKRDMDLVRHILAITADKDEPLTPDYFTDGYDKKLVEYHILIMCHAGLIDADLTPRKSGGRRNIVYGLTWEGQDYLAAVEDDTIWKKTKATVLNAVGSASLAVIKTTAEAIASAAIKATLGI